MDNEKKGPSACTYQLHWDLYDNSYFGSLRVWTSLFLLNLWIEKWWRRLASLLELGSKKESKYYLKNVNHGAHSLFQGWALLRRSALAGVEITTARGIFCSYLVHTSTISNTYFIWWKSQVDYMTPVLFQIYVSLSICMKQGLVNILS